MNHVALAEVVPYRLIVETADLVKRFHESVLPFTLKDVDMVEILYQVSDVLTEANWETNVRKTDKIEMVHRLHCLPEFNRIVSRQFFDTVERQHLLKAATFELGWSLYRRLISIGAYDSHQFKGKFPYAFDKLVAGGDSAFFHVPF